MRPLWLALPVVLVVVIIFALPAIAWVMLPEPEPRVDAEVTVTFRAYRASANDYSKSGYSITWAVSGEPKKVSYFDYIGQWWGDVISPGQVAVPTSFPYVVCTVVEVTLAHQYHDSGYRAMPDDYEPYTYGTYFEKSFTLTIPHGHELFGAVQIYHAQSTSVYISQYWTVP